LFIGSGPKDDGFCVDAAENRTDLFEDSPSLSSGIFLIPGQFMKLSQNRRVGLKR
jgi:hypothetical protein